VIKLKPILIPRSLAMDAAKMRRAIRNGMEAAAKAAKADFGVTTQTWEHQPEFTIERPSDFERIIGTDDEIYGYVDQGTKPHVITAKPGKALVFLAGGRPKTVPKAIRSNKGATGNTIVYTKQVQHPGTEAREFTETIGEKWDERLAETVQRAIDSEV
jgi:hypothetical protein